MPNDVDIMDDYFNDKDSFFKAANFDENFDKFYQEFSSDFINNFLSNKKFKQGGDFGLNDSRFDKKLFSSTSLFDDNKRKANGLRGVSETVTSSHEDTNPIKGIFKDVLKSYLSQEMAAGYYKQYKSYADAVMMGDSKKAMEIVQAGAKNGLHYKQSNDFTDYFSKVFAVTNDIVTSLRKLSAAVNQNEAAFYTGEGEQKELNQKNLDDFLTKKEVTEYNQLYDRFERIIKNFADSSAGSGSSQSSDGKKMAEKVSSWYETRKSRDRLIGKITKDTFTSSTNGAVGTKGFDKFKENLENEDERFQDMVTDLFTDYDLEVNGKGSALTYLKNFNLIGSGKYGASQRSDSAPIRKHYMAMNDSFFNVNSSQYATNVSALHMLMQYFNQKNKAQNGSGAGSAGNQNNSGQNNAPVGNPASAGSQPPALQRAANKDAEAAARMNDTDVKPEEVNGGTALENFQKSVNAALQKHQAEKSENSKAFSGASVNFLNKVADDLYALGYKKLVKSNIKSNEKKSVPTEFEQVYTKMRSEVSSARKTFWGVKFGFVLPTEQMIGKLAQDLESKFKSAIKKDNPKALDAQIDAITRQKSIYTYEFEHDVLTEITFSVGEASVDITLVADWNSMRRSQRRIQYMIGMPVYEFKMCFTHGECAPDGKDSKKNIKDFMQTKLHLCSVFRDGTKCKMLFSSREKYFTDSRVIGVGAFTQDLAKGSISDVFYKEGMSKDKLATHLPVIQTSDVNGLDKNKKYFPQDYNVSAGGVAQYGRGTTGYGSREQREEQGNVEDANLAFFNGVNFASYLKSYREMYNATWVLCYDEEKNYLYASFLPLPYGGRRNPGVPNGERKIPTAKFSESGFTEFESFESRTTEHFNYVAYESLKDGLVTNIPEGETYKPANLFQYNHNRFQIDSPSTIETMKQLDGGLKVDAVPFRTDSAITYKFSGEDEFFHTAKANKYDRNEAPTNVWGWFSKLFNIKDDSYSWLYKLSDYYQNFHVTSFTITNINFIPANKMFFRSNLDVTKDDQAKNFGFMTISAGGVGGVSGSNSNASGKQLVDVYSTTTVLQNQELNDANLAVNHSIGNVFYTGDNKDTDQEVTPDDFAPGVIHYDLVVRFKGSEFYDKPSKEL